MLAPLARQAPFGHLARMLHLLAGVVCVALLKASKLVLVGTGEERRHFVGCCRRPRQWTPPKLASDILAKDAS